MATITPTVEDVSGEGSVKLFTWTLVGATSDAGAPLEWSQWADRSVMITAGTWGGATCVIEGSNDLTTWLTLADNGGNAITTTADKIEAIVELTRYVRPRLSVGGTTPGVKVTLMCRINQPLRS